MNIKNYTEDGTFLVEYVPKNTNCQSAQISVRFDVTNLTTDDILEKLKLVSPQYEWETQIKSTIVNHDIYRGIINNSYEIDSVTIQPSNLITQPATDTNIQVLIQQELQRLEGDTV